MAGIISYGGYLPRFRLNRMAVAKNMGWFSPALYAASNGERSMANWDEDCLTMAVAAGQDALIGVDKSGVDAVYMASTTLPFADRDNAGIVKTALNLRDDILSANFASTLKSGPTALMTALEAVKGGDKRRILVTASDKRRSKAGSNQEMMFGDGAAALVVGSEKPIAEYLGGYAISLDFVDHYRGDDVRFDYNWEERWVRDEGFAKVYPAVLKGALDKAGLKAKDITKFIYPCIFAAAHKTMSKAIGAKPEQLSDPMYGEVGECGTAHSLLMFARELETANPGDVLLVAGIGQGAVSMIFRITDAIKSLPDRCGVSGCLANRKEMKTYTKWLQYNDLIQTDLGGRGDQDLKTGLSALYRNRKYILGFIGGKCKKCGTPQIPAQRICVKPNCGAVDAMEDYEFSDKQAKILTYTADNLAASLDPPAIYGMVEFKEGGRIMIEFTDCTMDEVEVGVDMKMTFRKKYYDPKRGFTGYFWKATPVNAVRR